MKDDARGKTIRRDNAKGEGRRDNQHDDVKQTLEGGMDGECVFIFYHLHSDY